MDFSTQNQCKQTPISSKSDKKWRSQSVWKQHYIGPFHLILHFDRFSNFCIFQPIWTKLVPNCTNFGSRSSFPGSKMSKLQFILAQGKIRSNFREKTGFSGNGEFSGFVTAWYPYQGTLRVRKPLRSRIAKFDSDFYSSGTVCVRHHCEYVWSESDHLGKNDNNGEIRDRNVFSRTPISTRGHPRAKIRVPTFIMGWNEVHRGHASIFIKVYHVMPITQFT